ncbi:hypothetical protein, partial [Akkermansia sp.]
TIEKVKFSLPGNFKSRIDDNDFHDDYLIPNISGQESSLLIGNRPMRSGIPAIFLSVCETWFVFSG